MFATCTGTTLYYIFVGRFLDKRYFILVTCLEEFLRTYAIRIITMG